MNTALIRERLISLADPEYGEFVLRGAPSDYPVIGVRIPKIQELANEILKDPEFAEEFLAEFEPQSREEIHLLSLVLTGKIMQESKELKWAVPETAKTEILKAVSRFDSWEMVDTFCSRMKCIKKNRAEWLDFVDELLKKTGEEGEFFVRTGLVLLLDYYVGPEWIQVVFERILEVKDRDEYYVKMAVAWLTQVCFVKFPDLTFGFLRTAELPDWTLKKAVSKIQDSYRIDSEWKEKAKTLLF